MGVEGTFDAALATVAGVTLVATGRVGLDELMGNHTRATALEGDVREVVC